MKKFAYTGLFLAVVLVLCVMAETARADIPDIGIFRRYRRVPNESGDLSGSEDEEEEIIRPDFGRRRNRFFFTVSASVIVLMLCTLKWTDRTDEADREDETLLAPGTSRRWI